MVRETNLLGSYVIFDPLLNSGEYLLSRDSGQIRAIQNRIDDADILVAHFGRDYQNS